jgi:Ankyrin repeats (3 copies)
MREDSRIGFPKTWMVLGSVLLAGTTLFVGRILYEETFLTLAHGPQMVGFAMMHGAVPFFLMAGLVGVPGSVLWIVGSLVLLIKRRFRVPLTDWIPIVGLVTVLLLLLIPYGTWKEITVNAGGTGSHGNDFMVQAAVDGNQRLVTHLLRRGSDINYEDAGGTTALSGAAVEGQVKMIRYLVSKGANVNRKNGLSSQSPLMAAAEMGKRDSVDALLDSGADPCAMDREGHNAAGLAKKYGHADIAQYLSSRFNCQEKVIDACADTSVSACVH